MTQCRKFHEAPYLNEKVQETDGCCERDNWFFFPGMRPQWSAQVVSLKCMYVRGKLNGLNSVFLFVFGVQCDKNNCKRRGLELEIECDRSWRVRRRSENDGTLVLVYKIIKNKNLNLKIIPSKKWDLVF